MIGLASFLNGKKTYIMIAVDAVDHMGVAAGYWEGSQIRSIVEFVFTAVFFRMGVQSSGPVK